jgi:hypothetical protein
MCLGITFVGEEEKKESERSWRHLQSLNMGAARNFCAQLTHIP